jgi:hypothetical protein
MRKLQFSYLFSREVVTVTFAVLRPGFFFTDAMAIMTAQ